MIITKKLVQTKLQRLTNAYKEIEANLHTIQLEEAYKLGFKDSLKISNT